MNYQGAGEKRKESGKRERATILDRKTEIMLPFLVFVGS